MRKIKSLGMLFLAFSFLLTVQILYAQRPPGGAFPEERRRERLREEIETLKMWKMLEVLDLSSEQSDKFLPAWREVQKAHKVFRVKREDLLEELELALGEEQKVKKKRIAEVFDQLKMEKSKLEEAQEKFRARAKEVLTLEQQARLLLFEERFEKRMMEMIRKYRGKRGFEE